MKQRLKQRLPAHDCVTDVSSTSLAVRRAFQVLGPGILFAASSVGTSHIVQSTRAGAAYGPGMAVIILFACFIKYPIFRFGTDYAAATGYTLIDSYFRQGRYAVAIYTLEILVTMFVFTAAVTIVTAGLVNQVLDLDADVRLVAASLFALCAFVLISGRYEFFENVTKGFVLLFLVMILVAVVLTVPGLNWSYRPLGGAAEPQFERLRISFMIALAGFMPTAAGAAVFQSLWVCAKSMQLDRPLTLNEARLDLNIGYILTAFLALCFLLMGTVLMFQSGVAVADSSTAFAGQLIQLFTRSIGGLALPVIATAVIAVMFTTMLTMIDACPRAMSALLSYRAHYEALEISGSAQKHSVESNVHEGRYYMPLVITQCAGAMLVIVFLATSFKTFIDFATTVAFLTAPALAFLNHRAVHSKEMPRCARPSRLMSAWSIAGIVIMGTLALAYLFYVALT